MIGIFDSGIGGATVLECVLSMLPNYHYIYYSDSINNPYGDKTPEELNVITKKIVNYLINRGCKIITIACNTASCMCKDFLRNEFEVPIIAIEPALKLVYDNNFKGKTLVMATKGTIESNKFLELYHNYDNHNMILISCVGLADLIEKNDIVAIKDYLKCNINYNDVENVVLGCTHYPLIKEEIREVLGNVKFFDGSMGIAKRLQEVIKEHHIQESESKVEFIDSSNSEVKKNRFWALLSKEF